MTPRETLPVAPPAERCPWLRRFGVGAFAFFLVKGLLWLIVPAVLVATGMQCG